MMLKGCSKRVIVIRDTGNDLFEEAIFFLKPDKEQALKLKNEQDFVAEANKLISSKSLGGLSCGVMATHIDARNKRYRNSVSKRRELGIFLSGAAIATAGAVILTFLL